MAEEIKPPFDEEQGMKILKSTFMGKEDLRSVLDRARPLLQTNMGRHFTTEQRQEVIALIEQLAAVFLITDTELSVENVCQAASGFIGFLGAAAATAEGTAVFVQTVAKATQEASDMMLIKGLSQAFEELLNPKPQTN